MSGTVAVGAALSGATVRVLDATGKTIASGKAVDPKTGAYAGIALSGGGPYRVEACGLLAGRQRCVWGATTTGGKLNLTPLTSAVTVLAGNQSPEGLMSGAVQGLSDTALAAAQTRLQAALAPALTDAGLAADFDFLLGSLTPNTHTGYDRLLDTIQVNLGQDGSSAFVQLTPRVGAGLAHLTPSATLGSLTVDAKAASLNLIGLDTFVQSMQTATANEAACTGTFAALVDAAAQYSLTGIPTGTGPAGVSQLFCFRLKGLIPAGAEPLYGGTLLRPEINRCDFSGTDPVCRLNSLNWQTTLGDPRVLAVEQLLVQRPSGWRFLGNRLSVQASATARTVLTRRVDAAAPDAQYRYLDIAIPVTSGLACAKVSQKDSNGASVVLGYYKPGSGGAYLSLWSVSLSDGTPSLNPNSGTTLGAGIVALPLTGDAAGDTVVRNFAQAGQNLKLELYTDAACTAAWTGPDGAAINLDLQGLPPFAGPPLAGQPWPTLAAATNTALSTLKGAAAAKATLAASWTAARAGNAMNSALLCVDVACALPLAQLGLAGSAASASLSGTLAAPLAATDFKQLRLLGRAADGTVLQADYQSCASVAAGSVCK